MQCIWQFCALCISYRSFSSAKLEKKLSSPKLGAGAIVGHSTAFKNSGLRKFLFQCFSAIQKADRNTGYGGVHPVRTCATAELIESIH